MTEQASTSRFGGRRATTLLAIAVALAVVAAAAAVYFGVAWANAAGSDSGDYSAERDNVQRVGEGAVLNFTTIDFTKPDDYVRKVSGATTGQLHDELAKPETGARYRKQIAGFKANASSKILDSAVTALDLKQGTADMIVAFNTTVTRQKSAPDTQPSWMQLSLQKTGDGWKVSKLGAAPGSSTGVGVGSGP